ncbi:MAG: hypothetical protein AB8D52_00420 [Gammaproteobacteria bacterium]
MIRKYELPFNVLSGVFAFSGVPLIAILFILFDFASLIIATIFLTVFILWVIELKKHPLLIYTVIEQKEYSNKSRKQLIGLAIVVVIAVFVIYIDT